MTADRDPPERPKPPDLESLRQELPSLASIADPTERLLEVAALIGESLADLGVPGDDVSFESPGEALEPGDEGEWAELGSGRRVKVLSIEDMLLWRLREWVHWHHASGFHQAAHLLLSDEVDTERLDRRAREEGLTRALRELRGLAADVEAGRIVEEWEITELGKEIERQSYSPSNDE